MCMQEIGKPITYATPVAVEREEVDAIERLCGKRGRCGARSSRFCW